MWTNMFAEDTESVFAECGTVCLVLGSVRNDGRMWIEMIYKSRKLYFCELYFCESSDNHLNEVYFNNSFTPI